MGAKVIEGRLNITCKECGHKTIIRQDWKEWLKERKKTNGTITHHCEACDWTFEGKHDEFRDTFFTLDKNGCL